MLGVALCGLLLAGYTTADRIEVETRILRGFHRGAKVSTEKRRYGDAAFFYIEDNCSTRRQ